METESQQDRDLRAARNETLFRAVNEKLRELNEAFSEVSEMYAIACECADVSCVETLHVSVQEYLTVREHPRRFLVLRDHVYENVERVLSSADGYVVVEKTAAVSEITDATDPNAEGQFGGGRLRDGGGAPCVAGERSTSGPASSRRARRPVRSNPRDTDRGSGAARCSSPARARERRQW